LKLIKINQNGELKCSFNYPIYDLKNLTNEEFQKSLKLRVYSKGSIDNSAIKAFKITKVIEE